MKDNNVYKPLKVQEKVLDIVEECFKNENNGIMDARQIALEKLDEFLIKTGDGSFTLLSEGDDHSSETMHTYHGGVEESLEKYVKPAHLIGKDDVHVLDICSGLGYTAAICLEYLSDENQNPVKKPNICIEMVEISPLTLAAGLIIPSHLKSYEIVKKAIENKLYDIGFLKHRMITSEIPGNIKLNLHLTDAREIVKNMKSSLEKPNISLKHDINAENGVKSLDKFNESEKIYDAIILAPFSPGVSPELYTLEFLNGLKSLVKDNGMFLTYTSSSAVRSALISLGLHVGEGPSFGRRGGTLASMSPGNITKPLSNKDERMIALTDAGMPFTDPDLNSSGDEITARRQNDRSKARNEYKFASTVKSPVYLYNDISESRLRRRVLKDLRKLGLEDLISEKSKYLVCPQYKGCICGNECEDVNSSRERVVEMEKRLNKIVEIRKSRV
jgi:tRNA U34 5-methylaminomethyl-2-thiouridine-forming methyltransferase MnmC